MYVESEEPLSRLKILCNHLLVLDFVIENSLGFSECEKFWKIDTSWVEIEIGELNVEYRKAPGGTLIFLILFSVLSEREL